jgi:hypothetical protein
MRCSRTSAILPKGSKCHEPGRLRAVRQFRIFPFARVKGSSRIWIVAVGVASKIAPGMRFGRLTAVSRTAERKWGQVVWCCRCDCGSTKEVVSGKLSSGKARSCGCLLRDELRERNRKMARRDYRTEVIECAAKHHLDVILPAGKLTWETKLAVTCAECGQRRRTNIGTFLKIPLACRRCSKRIGEDQLRVILTKQMITLDRLEYPAEGGQGRTYCECQVCRQKFDRSVGELVSGNRGCPHCLNFQEMCARIILTHNLGGDFAPRQRPKWMGGLELDGWNKKVAINGRTVAFEYMGHYWHKADAKDRKHAQAKVERCAGNGVTLLVIWASADRPNWTEQLKACQRAIDEAGLNITLKMPPPRVMTKIARAIPQYIRERLSAINHDPIQFDQRGHVRSLCRLSGKVVTQDVSSLSSVRGCRYCQSHSSRQDERRLNARRGALAMWTAHRHKRRYDHVKITDKIVGYIRQHDFQNPDVMSDDVAKRFGIHVSPSGLQYARSGKTHKYLDEQYPPVRKSASPYTKHHAAVKLASKLRGQGLSFGKISQALFHKGHKTLKGTAFSAAQVRSFMRFSEANT